MSDTLQKQQKICPYMYSRGGRAGQKCGSFVMREGIYCAKHKQSMDRRNDAINRLINKQPKNEKLQDIIT